MNTRSDCNNNKIILSEQITRFIEPASEKKIITRHFIYHSSV